MSEQLVTALIQTWGPLGAVLVICFLALRSKDKQLTEAQEKRVTDAEKYSAKLLELVAEQNKHKELLTQALNGNADAIRALREIVQGNDEAVRSLVDRDRGLRLPGSPRRG